MGNLTLGFSSLTDRVSSIRVGALPVGWRVNLVTQGSLENPTNLNDDSHFDAIRHLDSIGVAKSRNANIDLCETEYLVFSDDDVRFEINGLREVVEYLDANLEVSLVLARAQTPAGQLRKSYPNSIQKLGLFNSARAATYEMVIRVSEVSRLGVRFDENFGAGVENYLGDEYIFIADLIRKGGKAIFAPITIATHPEESSGGNWGSDRDRRARAKIFNRVFGPLAPLVRLAFGLRRLSQLGSVANLFRFVLGQ
jgi:hypothetical protein